MKNLVDFGYLDKNEGNFVKFEDIENFSYSMKRKNMENYENF